MTIFWVGVIEEVVSAIFFDDRLRRYNARVDTIDAFEKALHHSIPIAEAFE